MKHFKWALSLILAGAFCLSGAGCGGEGTKNDATFGTAMNDAFYNPFGWNRGSAIRGCTNTTEIIISPTPRARRSP